MDLIPLEENLSNIKILAEQMAKIKYDIFCKEINQQKTSNSNIKIPIQKTSNKKLNRNESDSQKLPKNLASFKTKKKLGKYLAKKYILELGKIKDGNSNINTNTNLNTNINTNTNLNSYLNTYSNNNFINENNDNFNINENNLYSDKNSEIYPINENSSNISSSNIENKEKNENNIENAKNVNENKIIKKDKNITVEIINPILLKKYHNESFDDIISKININSKEKINNKIKKTKISKSTLYEREIRNLERKNNKLQKKRELLLYKE